METELALEYLPTDSLTPYARNARTHSPGQIKQIAQSIRTFGFINPVIIDSEGVVVAGHARVLAAKQLGLATVPVIPVHHLSEAKRRAYILADNKLAENAGWDNDLLRVELEFLTQVDIDFDVEITGFATTDIDLILSPESPEAEPDAPPPPLPSALATVSRTGDLWWLGRHRIVCGDCRDAALMARLMDGRVASMVITDPPYNVAVPGHVCGKGKHQHANFAMASGEMSSGEFIDFLVASLGSLARASRDGAVHFVFMDWRHLPEVLAAGDAVYDSQLNLCIWAKTNGGMGSLYRSQHELVLVYRKGAASHQNNVELGSHGRYRTNVWSYPGISSFGNDRDNALTMHPTVKPVQLIADAILDVSSRGDIVLDGFLGSGTAVMAAEQTGRIAYGVEIDPRYVDVTLQRWMDARDTEPVLTSTGQPFSAVRDERIAAVEEEV